jgi:MFS family permease
MTKKPNGEIILASISTAAPKAGLAQGLTVIIAGFLPILAIVTMFPAIPAIIGHFAPSDPSAPTKVPSMVTAPGLTIALVAMFAGLMVDRFGRRRLLLVSTFFYGLVGAAPFLLESLDVIYGSRLLLGLCEAVILTTINTLIADYWPDEGRRKWLALQGLVGPALSSVMIFFAGTMTAWRWNGIFLLYLLALPIWLAMLRWMFEPSSDATARAMLGMDEKDDGSFPWAAMLGIAGITLFSSAIYYVFIVNGATVWTELGVSDPQSIGQITALPSLFILAGAGLFWWTGNRGVAPPVQIGMFLLLLGAGLATMGLTRGWQGMILGMALQQKGAGMAIPTLIAWAQSQLPFQHRGRGMGIWTATFFFGQFSSPLLVSLLRGALGTMQAAFLVAGIIGAVGAVLLLFVLPGRGNARSA